MYDCRARRLLVPAETRHEKSWMDPTATTMVVYLLRHWHRTSGFNLAAPSVHRQRGCRAIWTAHQEQRLQVHLGARKRFRIQSYKAWWMAVVKRQPHGGTPRPEPQSSQGCKKFWSRRSKRQRQAFTPFRLWLPRPALLSEKIRPDIK